MEFGINLKVSELKKILSKCPDDMDVIIPVIDEEDCNRIFGFRHVRTIGILSTIGESDALCLNASSDGADISSQIKLHKSDITCKKVLY